MPCSPLQDNQFDIPSSGIPGFGVQIPQLNIPFPQVDLPDLSGLFDALGFALPPGVMKPGIEPDYLNDVYGAVNELLQKFMPFLMVYKFFLPVLNLILCIIEVLCAIANPFKLIRAIKRLFRQCIPEFLSLFPFFALIIMIISLLLLILQLIAYLLNRILQIIEVIIANIIALSRATDRLENDGIIAIVKKIGDLLCFLQGLFVIFGTILSIIQIIKALTTLSFRIPPCDSTDGSDDGCCTTDVCPDFIKNNEQILSNSGTFVYYNQIAIDSGLSLPPGFNLVSTVRNESWQFYDAQADLRTAFINIVKAYDLPPGVSKVFFPPGTVYTATTASNAVPYTIDFRFLYNPNAFGRTDPKGTRYMRVKNCIIQNPPTEGTYTYDGTTLEEPFNGTLNLIGGYITEDDGTPLLDNSGKNISMNSFIHNDMTMANAPVNNGIVFDNLSYTFRINHEVLFGASLITLGCIPSVALDRDAVNSTIGAQFNSNGAAISAIGNALPDVSETQNCIVSSITKFRQKISVETANVFKDEITACLNNLSDQTKAVLTQTIKAGFDQYKSDFTIDPSIQFTTKPIVVSVSLNESSGQSMANNLPADSGQELAGSITADASLGEVSRFAYDGYGLFTANITSSKPGNGTIKVAFDNKYISILNNPTSIDQQISVSIKELQYTFVDSPSLPSGADSGIPRRDEGDVSRNNGS